jgi:hypothetical protein
MRQVKGIQMTLPEGKLPGYYAQIIKRIADAAQLIDREKDLLFTANEDTDAVLDVLNHYNVTAETGPWLLLDEPDWEHSRIWDDYALQTNRSNTLLDLSLTAVVSVHPLEDDSEPQLAELQLEEHRIASLQQKNCRLIAIDRQLLQLAEGIASAYRCQVRLHH